MALSVASRNALRKRVQELWGSADPQPRAIIMRCDDPAERAGIVDAMAGVCSELGIRHVPIDLAEGLTREHEAQLRRAAPRVVVVVNVEGVPEEERGTIEATVRAAARTLPICVVGENPQTPTSDAENETDPQEVHP